MKISGPGSVRTNGPRRRNASDGASGAGFASHLDTPSQAAAPSISEASQIASVGALIALQAGDDGARGASGKEVERAEDLLDRLDQIRVGLLTGSMSRGTLNSIVARLEQRRREGVEPRLMGLIDEIELRAKVELAKLSMI